jgi:hypothetical protein
MIRIENGSVVGARAQREVEPHLGPEFSKLHSNLCWILTVAILFEERRHLRNHLRNRVKCLLFENEGKALLCPPYTLKTNCVCPIHAW